MGMFDKLIANLKAITDEYSQNEHWNGYACFYNLGQTQSAVGGSATSGFSNLAYYTTIPSGDVLNDGQSYYTTAQQTTFPSLRWEIEFVNLW